MKLRGLRPQILSFFSWVAGLCSRSTSSRSKCAPPVSISKFASKCQRIVAAAVSPDDIRCRSLILMKTILESAPHIHCLELHTSCQFEKLWIALQDSFADKATGTLYKRSRTLWCYYWLRDSVTLVVQRFVQGVDV